MASENALKFVIFFKITGHDTLFEYPEILEKALFLQPMLYSYNSLNRIIGSFLSPQ